MNLNAVRYGWLPVCLVTLSGLLQFGAPLTTAGLRFDPALIHGGELWRLLSAHFVHLGWGHYLMNSIALLAISVLYASTPGVMAWWLLVSAATVSAGLFWLNPELGWYVGMSGMLHGLLIAGSLREIVARHFIGGVMLLAVTGKLIWEQLNGPVPGSETAAGGNVIVDAHLYGALGGAVACSAQYMFARWRGRRG